MAGGGRLGRADGGATVRLVLGAVVRAARAAMRAAVSPMVEGGRPTPSDGRGGAFAKGDDDKWVILVLTGATGGMLLDGRGLGIAKAEPAACAALVSGS